MTLPTHFGTAWDRQAWKIKPRFLCAGCGLVLPEWWVGACPDCASYDIRPVPRSQAQSSKRRITPRKRAEVYARDGMVCVACGTPDNLTIDHILPVSKGGTNEVDNLQTMCQPCNGRKGNRVDDGAGHSVPRRQSEDT